MALTLPSIAICSKGDPYSPRTWSGTPAHLCAAFQAAGVRVFGADCFNPAAWPFEIGVKILSKLFYLNSRYAALGEVSHAWRARRAQASLSQIEGAAHFLHLHALGALSLPVEPKKSATHSILLDTTWNLWKTYSTDAFKVSSRLAGDADKIEQAVYHAAAHCFSLSQYVAHDLIHHYHVPPERVSVIGTGRGALRPYYGRKDFSNGSILFAAKERFVDKGGELLLKAFRLAHRRNPKLSLTIVGRDEYEKQFKGIGGVIAKGHVRLDELQTLFNEASLFAMPAVFEPWGLVYLEALACRMPVLGLRDHALPEITCNGQYGFCLQSANTEEMAEALLKAFANPKALEKMGTEGQTHCLSHYTWEKTVQRIVGALTQE